MNFVELAVALCQLLKNFAQVYATIFSAVDSPKLIVPRSLNSFLKIRAAHRRFKILSFQCVIETVLACFELFIPVFAGAGKLVVLLVFFTNAGHIGCCDTQVVVRIDFNSLFVPGFG